MKFSQRNPQNSRGAFCPLFVKGWAALAILTASCTLIVVAQERTATRFRLGEKLAYNISFGKFLNAGYAETHVLSRGRLGGKDAVEIRAKVKTYDLVSAAFFLLDESRTVFAAPDTGLPLYIASTSNDSVIPKETVQSYLETPTQNFDLVTLIFKGRDVSGAGSFTLFEDNQLHTVTFTPTVTIASRTEIGNFEATVSRVQSDYLTAKGISEFFVHYSTDEARIPVVVRFSTARGEFKAVLSSITLPEPAAAPLPPLTSPTPTPKPAVAPIPGPTPEAAVENLPLPAELGFELGEILDYRISQAGRPAATISVGARERRRYQGIDTLSLTAIVTSVEPGVTAFRLGDAAAAYVSPDSLVPRRTESRFASAVRGINQIATFDQRTGAVTVEGGRAVDAPIGTHSLLSLLYAMRSFNLKPSKDAANPVNDTRVAVFWENRAHVFTLRPAGSEDLTINGEKVSAQLININTGDAQLDALAIKVWLGTDSRVPVRITFGSYQADLFAQTPRASP